MDNPETSASEQDEHARFREIGLRAKRRTLKDHEYKASLFITAACAYVIFILLAAVIGFIAGAGEWFLAITCSVLALGFGNTIYGVWHPAWVHPVLLGLPSVVFVILTLFFNGGQLTTPLYFALAALGTGFYLSRLRQQLAELPD